MLIYADRRADNTLTLQILDIAIIHSKDEFPPLAHQKSIWNVLEQMGQWLSAMCPVILTSCLKRPHRKKGRESYCMYSSDFHCVKDLPIIKTTNSGDTWSSGVFSIPYELIISTSQFQNACLNLVIERRNATRCWTRKNAFCGTWLGPVYKAIQQQLAMALTMPKPPIWPWW
jgi:hypothetical protein